jgi:hypothetical protein
MNKQEIEKAIEELKYQEDMRAKGIDIKEESDRNYRFKETL